MRIRFLAALPLLGAIALMPSPSSAQVTTPTTTTRRTTTTTTTQLGSPLTITTYSTGTQGDWHSNYMKWRPTTVYWYNNQYYPRSVRGGRAVEVYHSGTSYFLPPQDQAWTNHGDTRFNYKQVPTSDDYTHITTWGHPPAGDGHPPI
ncbi:MAG TPA: hypothetical protein VGM20_02035 [Gemmatimonadales bacterium]|jgi:hypothetical protein